MQYGLVQGRATQMAIVNTNDIIKYFNHIGTAVFGCSLDAEKVFDAIPHSNLAHDKYSRGQNFSPLNKLAVKS